MRFGYYITGTVILMLLTGCEERWEEHYDSIPETVDQNIWEAVQNEPDLSTFVEYVKDMNYDSLFRTDNPYTLFIPDNQAFIGYTDTASVTTAVLDYHISAHIIPSSKIQGKRKIQTLSEKFALLDNSGGILLFDEISVEYESPLYSNGKYFTLKQVASPRPNIYEYYAENNPVFKSYVDAQDSIILDMEESRPIGFDDEGNTVYDSVSYIYNEFEEKFFPVREEFRNRTATVVFPKAGDYNEALTDMAISMGSVYQDYSDIPLEWQNEILIPYLLERGVFENMLEESFFYTPTSGDTVKLKNVLGDSVIIDYEVDERVLCSNGFVYDYKNFQIPDTLYKGSVNFEMESLVRETGIDRFAWLESVNVVSDESFKPNRVYNTIASNDSLISLSFPPAYTGAFSVEFVIDNIFPRKYLMVIGTNINIGGIYEIYVNDELVRTMDWGDYLLQYGVLWSVTGTDRYVPQGTYNKFDALVDSKAKYGETRIRFKYIGPGRVLNKGLAIDNIEFFPYDF
ncbi:MAG: fasciclin domain-containing protein [Bacteroidales bacterium]